MVTLKDLIESGVHFGHRASRWHPNMARYIYGKHNHIHIVDLRETIKGILRASHFLTALTEAGHEVIFVGTKYQAREIVRQHAERCGMHFVTHRWLGGTLTNFNTILSRLKRLHELEALESDASIALRTKKEVASIRRERRKIHRNLEGIRRLAKLPGALIVADIRRDYIAVKEARLMGIPVVSLVDTDCNPEDVDIVIPGNDDAYRSIELIVRCLADSVVAGRDKLVERQKVEEKQRLEEVQEEQRRAEQRRADAARSDAAAGLATGSGAQLSTSGSAT
ncbi:MAG: 30S ribosomal protein S2 [Planctomycetes bacterium]|nr:30S ribosomal protein S2 [Planctomycetota bacterium]